ncbi:hypothetical protein AcW1_005490 [Taiwanofungus camphoratus]|nr:hypothetical protein AcW1_005490 [Antrodia cinnamomea]
MLADYSDRCGAAEAGIRWFHYPLALQALFLKKFLADVNAILCFSNNYTRKAGLERYKTLHASSSFWRCHALEHCSVRWKGTMD